MRKIVTLFIFVFFITAVSFAQTTNQGSIVGTVKDPNSQVVPAATSTVTNVATNVSRTAVSDSSGN